MSAEERLRELGISLPAPAAAAGLYAPCIQAGSLLLVSGQIPPCIQAGSLLLVSGQIPRAPDARGKLGAGVTIEEGQALARECAINALGIVRAHLGSLDRVTKVVRLGGYVASAEGFTAHPQVINGASQVMLDVFGEAGRHARIAIGVAELPLGVPVEVEFMFEVA